MRPVRAGIPSDWRYPIRVVLWISSCPYRNHTFQTFFTEYSPFRIEGLHPFSKAVLSKKYTVLFAVPLLCPYRASDRLGKLRKVGQAGAAENRNIASKCDVLWPFFNSRACSSVGQSRGLIVPPPPLIISANLVVYPYCVHQIK